MEGKPKMKLIISFLIGLVLISGIGFAASSNLFFHTVIVEDQVPQNADMEVFISVENEGSRTLDDTRIRLVVPELGIIHSSATFDFQDDIRNQIFLVDLYGAEPGDYTAVIIASNDDESRKRHRFFTIY